MDRKATTQDVRAVECLTALVSVVGGDSGRANQLAMLTRWSSITEGPRLSPIILPLGELIVQVDSSGLGVVTNWV